MRISVSVSSVLLVVQAHPSFERLLFASDIRRALAIHEQRYDQPVETQHFGENENQDHADEESWLLGCAAHTCVADDTDCEAG